MSETSEYAIWLGMKQRCTNPNCPSWPNYGGRGITIDPRWVQSFEAFYQYVGPRPGPQHTIERIDNMSGYRPGNVRWATRGEQMINTRRNVRWTHAGQTHTISQWARILGVDSNTLWMRVQHYGWSIEKALSTPV